MNEIKINALIGIDPGAAGGIAVYIPSNPAATKVKVVKMPKDMAELRDFFVYYAENYRPLVFLEKLSVRPDDIKVEGDSANLGKLYRVQKMMANFEHLKALVETSGIPYVMTHPLKWQTALNLRRKGEDKADRKRRYVEVAHSKYPGIKTTLWNADALLLLHFGRVVLANDLKWVLANLPQREQNKLF